MSYEAIIAVRNNKQHLFFPCKRSPGRMYRERVEILLAVRACRDAGEKYTKNKINACVVVAELLESRIERILSSRCNAL